MIAGGEPVENMIPITHKTFVRANPQSSVVSFFERIDGIPSELRRVELVEHREIQTVKTN